MFVIQRSKGQYAHFVLIVSSLEIRVPMASRSGGFVLNIRIAVLAQRERLPKEILHS